jgi:TonB family protein
VTRAADVASPPPTSRVREDAMPGGVPYSVRVDEIRRRIQEALVYPPLARRREVEGESEVAFEIRAGGHPAGIEVVRSSGSTVLDAAAERAVRDAAPLPPVLGRLSVPIRFQLDGAESRSGGAERP